MTTEGNAAEIRRSSFDGGAKPADSLGFSPDALGQHYPPHYPQADDALGEPLSISQVARVIGCSDWTVRHRHMPHGLPHFRSGPAGKLVFFKKQVVKWILDQQKRGGR